MRYTYDDIKAEFRATHDAGDAWSGVMGWWFAIAGEMTERGMGTPDAWHYKCGLSGRDDGYEGDVCYSATSDALERFGAVLYRYDRALRHAGRAY